MLWIESLSLSHFRNYSALKLELGPEPIVLAGLNGAGKTNLLEAVSFLTPGRGLRRASINEVQRQGSTSPWAVAARIHTASGETVDVGTGSETSPFPLEGGRWGEAPDGGGGSSAEASRHPHPASGHLPPSRGKGEGKRLVRIDGKNKSQNELAKYFSALWLTPQMDALFLESDAARRKFLDRLVFAFDAGHASRVSDYEFAMRERNRLLQLPGYDAAWVGALEKEMAEFGVAMGAARLTMAQHLNQAIRASGFSFPKARLELDGFVEGELIRGVAALDIEEQARERLKRARGADAASGRCTFGLHRTVMRAWFDARNMPAESCSTGEQKALLLSIVLGQAMAVKEWKGAAPVLLLDEVVSHLDPSRRYELCEALMSLGSQVWLTGTDMGFFEGLGARAQRFAVEAGKARRTA